MPSGRKPDGDAALSNAERQARYRLRHQVGRTAGAIRARRPIDRRSRPQRWRDAVAELLTLQASYTAWLEALPDALRDTPTAETLQAIVDLDLEALASIEPPRDATDAIVACRESDGCSMVLAVGDGLKGCAARTGCAGFDP